MPFVHGFRSVGERFQQGRQCLGPQRYRSLDEGLGALKFDNRSVKVNGIDWQASAVRVAEAAVDGQENHGPQRHLCGLQHALNL